MFIATNKFELLSMTNCLVLTILQYNKRRSSLVLLKNTLVYYNKTLVRLYRSEILKLNSVELGIMISQLEQASVCWRNLDQRWSGSKIKCYCRRLEYTTPWTWHIVNVCCPIFDPERVTWLWSAQTDIACMHMYGQVMGEVKLELWISQW